MHHTREEVIERAIHEFELLDQLVANLSNGEWDRRLIRPETKDPWTVKDAVAHIAHWKADVARSVRKQKKSPEMRALDTNAANHLVYLRWHVRTAQEVLAWHRQVQEDVLAALRDAPEEWFSNKERSPLWPFDLVGHSDWHRVKDIERALKQSSSS